MQGTGTQHLVQGTNNSFLERRRVYALRGNTFKVVVFKQSCSANLDFISSRHRVELRDGFWFFFFFKRRLNAARNESAASSSCLNLWKNSTVVSSYCSKTKLVSAVSEA